MKRLVRTFALSVAVAATAHGMSWPGMTGGGWSRPSDDLSSVEPDTVSFSSLAVYVDRSGEYTFSVDAFDFDAVLFVYAGRFDPDRPRKDLVAGGTEVTYPFVEGVIYHLVTSGRGTGDRGELRARLEGPGTGRPAACFIGDEPFYSDEIPLGAQSVQGGLFCIVVFARTPDGTRTFGKAVGHRSDDSALFYFFNDANWELMVKVLDACRIHGRYWVFMSATTNVEVDVEVTSFIGDWVAKTYHNPLGRAFETVTDTQTFPCS